MIPRQIKLSVQTRSVVWLGIVSFFNDLSSEVVARVLPLYLLSVVGTSLIGIGFVEAIAESTSVFAKLLAGVFSDTTQRRKPFIFVGYVLSVMSRPFILAWPSLVTIALSRFVDKIGKGVRSAPRDALVAELSTTLNRGYHFGITRSLDTLGAVLGLGAVAAFLTVRPMNDTWALRIILVVASIAGLMALVSLWLGVKEPAAVKPLISKVVSFRFYTLDKRLQIYLVAAFFFALASSSDAFLIVRARDYGISLRDIFLLLTGFNLISAIGSFYLSKLSDKFDRKWMLIAGWMIYFSAYVIFGFSRDNPKAFMITLVMYGLYYGFTDGVEKALIADFETDNQKGKAFGTLGLVTGLGVVPANLFFAFVYKTRGAGPAFLSSAFFALIAIVILCLLKTSKKSVTETSF